jgi:pantetheine-phosphate adenylyltransferase
MAQSPSKKMLFSEIERRDLILKSVSHLENVQVESHLGLTHQFLKMHSAQVLIRGLRAVEDFEAESSMASMNLHLSPGLETLLMFSRPALRFISSRSVKEVAQHRGDLTGLVPSVVAEALREKFK